MNTATILFDGACNLCNASVRFIIANDPLGNFRFAALQSAPGVALLRGAGYTPASLGSIIVITDHGVYERSSAVLQIAARLRFPWPVFTVLGIIPVHVRDACYDWISRQRYRLFGKRNVCSVPTAEQRQRFI